MKNQNYFLSLVFLMITSLSFAQVQKAQTLQVGNTSTTTQSTSAALQIDDTNRGFLPPRMTTVQRDAIANPVAGLTIFNTTKNCLEWYNGTGWFNGCDDNQVSLTSNGTAVVSAWVCDVASVGTMAYNTPITGVTQTVKATVVSKGSYSISVEVAGITFAGSGTFAATGQQNVVLTATGTPTSAGTKTFALNTTPSCSFDREVSGVAPSAATNPVAVAKNTHAIISFTPSADNGGEAITYTVTSSPEGLTATGSTSPLDVTGLTNGTAYTFIVKASNTYGFTESVPSNEVTPAPTAPEKPSITSVTYGNQSVVVEFAPPANDGGSAITNYIVTSNTGATASGQTSPITVSGLTNGSAYTFTVVAENLIGTSDPSDASASVIPKTNPSAPTFTSITQTSTTAATVTLGVPNNGGSAITNYSVTATPGNITVSGSSQSLSFTGLTAGTAYTFTALVTNGVGDSPSATSSVFNLNKTGNMFTDHYSGVVNNVYTGNDSMVTHTTGVAFSQIGTISGINCQNEYISTQNSAENCPSSVTSSPDGNGNTYTYGTVYINGQCWLNRNSQDYPNPLGANRNTSFNTFNDSSAWAAPYGNNDSNALTDGLLYLWTAAMNRNVVSRGQGVCPTGFHVPTVCEFRFLLHGLGYNLLTGETNNTHLKLLATDEGGNNQSGMNMRRSGSTTNTWAYFDYQGSYRTSTSSFNSGVLLISNTNVNFPNSGILSTRGYSLRCIKN